MKPMKIVWICGFSNAKIRERLKISRSLLEPFFLKIVRRKYDSGSDSGVWISNGINEMKVRDDVELHIITPYRNLADRRQEFTIDEVRYHFFRDENSSLGRKVIRYLFTRNSATFRKNRKHICELIGEICPDLVHVIGAENPYYSLSLLDIPKAIPTILQLQALLVSLKGMTSGNVAVNFAYKGEIEKSLIQRADYIGTCVPSFVEYIKKNIKHDAKIVNTSLAMAQKIDLSETVKEYTFVHYAASLSTVKATDIALKAFFIAHNRHPEITLDLIGNYTDDFKSILDAWIEKNGVREFVRFEGRLPTHDDVIRQIRKAQFALLPIKTDIIPNTLHEAMANGLPLLTTATEEGTVKLNARRESALISPIGDVESLATNMIYLLEHPDKAEQLKMNAAVTEAEHDNNYDIINHWVEIYKAVLTSARKGKVVPEEYLL